MHRIAFVSPISNGYVYRLVQGAVAHAEAAGGLTIREFLLTRDTLSFRQKNDPLGRLLAWKPDGILGFLEDEELAMLRENLPTSCPVVSMCAVREGVTMVCGSFASAANVAVNHFRQFGLRSMTLFSCEIEDASFGQRFSRVAKPFAKVPHPLIERADAAMLEDPYRSVLPVPERVKTWLEGLPRPTGIFCRNLGGGSYLIRVCACLGLRVPEDISIIGTDDTDHALATQPTLTTVVPLTNQIGSEAARLLAQMIDGHPAPNESVRLDAMDLKVRESTGLQRSLICDIAGALSHIDQHACRGLSVRDLHKATQNVCGKTFHNHFKAATGVTPGEAILRRQVEEVSRLLGETRLSMTLIAENCGFSSSSDLARRFRALAGVSPSEFRKNSLTSKQ